MNILFFLKPKEELDLIYEEDSLGTALDRIEKHQFSTIPIINEKTGQYIGTLCEGDLLRELKKRDTMAARTEWNRPVMKVKRKVDYRAVRINSNIEELFKYAKEQNFVPVVDDTGVLIGIVTRKAILQFAFDIMNKYVDHEKADLQAAAY